MSQHFTIETSASRPIIALYQPDIAQNLGAIARLSVCMNLPLHIIEPCGFPLDDKRIRRSGMDYLHDLVLVRHSSWEAFCEAQNRQARMFDDHKKALHHYIL